MRTGKYQHYKGDLYLVTGTATHSETMEEMVVYQCLYGDFGFWVRPRSMFEEELVFEGRKVKRFTFLEENKLKIDK